MTAHERQLLVAHVVFRFDVGGLENGVVNLLNRLPADRFQHAVVALTEVASLRDRVRRDDVTYIALNKTAGPGVKLWPALFRVFRSLRPDVVHTRNLAPLEACLPAWVAGVPARVHGEHGWDIGDLDGSNAANRRVRRFYRPFVSRYIALSQHIETYLHDAVGVPRHRISQIYNGVDTAQFSAKPGTRTPLAGSPFNDPALRVFGTVGRLSPVKDQAALIRALGRLQKSSTELRARLRLAIVGDGPLNGDLRELARVEGVADSVWFSGVRSDVAAALAGLDVFALPSLAEGISNTLLEAMSCARPCVATAVGGNVELIEDGRNGSLIPSADEEALDRALLKYLRDTELARRHGETARVTVKQRFSIERMVSEYAAIYESVAKRCLRRAAATKQATLETGTGH